MIFEFEGKRLVTSSDNYYVAAGAQLIGDVRLGEGTQLRMATLIQTSGTPARVTESHT